MFRSRRGRNKPGRVSTMAGVDKKAIRKKQVFGSGRIQMAVPGRGLYRPLLLAEVGEE